MVSIHNCRHLCFPIWTRLSASLSLTDGLSASLSWNKAPIWGVWSDFYYCLRAANLLMWRALSDERTGLSLTIAADPRQHSHSRVRVPWDSRPYFTVSHSRIPFSSPPMTRRATVEVFDTASYLRIKARGGPNRTPSPNNASALVCVFVAAGTRSNKTLPSNGCLCECFLTSYNIKLAYL
jgi:hypothetical protein